MTPAIHTVEAVVGLSDIDLETGEIVGYVQMPGKDRRTIRVPIEDILGWTAARRERDSTASDTDGSRP